MQQEDDKKRPRYDAVGYKAVTEALKDMLNQYPGLLDGEKILFSTLSDTTGISFYPVTGAVISEERTSVTGKVRQLCNYTFCVVYRTTAVASAVKTDIKEFLDDICNWLERQPVVIDGEPYQLEAYPKLTGGREIKRIMRQSMAYLDKVYEDNTQDWVCKLSLEYKNIFYRNR